MAIQNVKSTSASWMIMWDKTVVSVPIEVHTDKQVTGSIEKIMAGPSANDYYRAASYYHDAGKDMNMAYEWIKKANEGDNARFWTVRREALILADMGKKAEAIAAAQRSMDMAEKAGNKDYVHMNEASIKEWSK
jgi:tetratricopeptide (TPR) repeat protein